MSEATLGELAGKTLVAVRRTEYTLTFETTLGARFQLYHDQDCCESVTIEDVVGDLDDLVGAPLLMVQEVTHENENPDGLKEKECDDAFTWTFYKFATVKGYVTVRWYGGSNGYYSTAVDFRKLNPGEDENDV